MTREDSLALVAVHVITPETENWVWATFCGTTAVRRPQPGALPAPFRSFRMAVTESADLPVAEDGGPNSDGR